MKNSFRWLLVLSLITGLTSSCNRSIVQSQSGATAYKDDTSISASPAQDKDLTKITVSTASLKAIIAKKDANPSLADLAYNHKVERIDSLVESSFRHYGFNGTVLVGEKGKIMYEKAIGYADFSTGQQMDVNSIFQLASVSKQFTAMCIMMLKQAGKLSYDDDLTQYFPELPYKGITIRNLLNHTSGLPNYMWLVEDRWKQQDHSPYNDEVIALLAKYHPPVYFKPGAKFLYSNTGYMLLASIVEKVSGMDFISFAQKNIFTPLGMTNTFVYCTSKVCFAKNHLSGYKPARRGLYRVGPDVLDGSVGDKGVHSTVEDLFKWDQALYTDKLVRQDILAEAFTKGKLNNNHEADYGFGFRLVDRGGKRIIYHNGLWNGFRSAIIRDVADGTTIIVLNHTNSHGKQVVEAGIQSILNQGEAPYLMGSESEDEAKGGEK